MSRSRARAVLEVLALTAGAWLSLASSEDEGGGGTTPEQQPIPDTFVAPGQVCALNRDCPGWSATDLCAAHDECLGGYCVQKPAVDCSAVAGTTSCLAGQCNTSTGQCLLKALSDGNGCTSGDPCQTGGVCQAGTCKTQPVECSTTNCMNASCTPNVGCQTIAKPDGTLCDDGNACTFPDTCQGGYCQIGQVSSCDDANGCTADSCQPQTGCRHEPYPTGYACDDSDPCTSPGQCLGGECTVSPLGNGALCDDGNLCTSGTTCQGGQCQGGAPTVCPDPGEGPCYVNVCVPAQGCQTQALGSGEACTPVSDPCGATGYCSQGACLTSTSKPDGSDCTTQDCIVRQCQKGGCNIVSYLPTGSLCRLNLKCTYDGKCVNEQGQCGYQGPLGPVDCDDGDPCTSDTCAEPTGCAHTDISGCNA